MLRLRHTVDGSNPTPAGRKFIQFFIIFWLARAGRHSGIPQQVLRRLQVTWWRSLLPAVWVVRYTGPLHDLWWLLHVGHKVICLKELAFRQNIPRSGSREWDSTCVEPRAAADIAPDQKTTRGVKRKNEGPETNGALAENCNGMEIFAKLQTKAPSHSHKMVERDLQTYPKHAEKLEARFGATTKRSFRIKLLVGTCWLHLL